ncbi:DUF2802 domain-containing protein [Azospira restricta]|uniref:DUF2802 domain-containing protein n=1 Tax=Azospira restricta TaxID=404405 RepID=A0A974Y4Z4_9RHOO|nr:DUF2802 domain-containing protein [Azospira restricta]QRJ64939.1 DUF2802 domain-containing protein [Azospira restricta]
MTLDDLALGWREALLGVVALLVLYVGVVVVRLRRLRAPDPVPSPEAPAAAVPAPSGEQLAAAYVEPPFPWNEPPDTPGDDSRLAALDGEVLALRNELSALRGELASLREELRDEVARVNERVQAAQHVAPIYGDAMQMALAGHDAATIAERCGVARAEAELVVALIRNRDGSDDGDDAGSMMKER